MEDLRDLLDRALALEEQGREEEAIALYLQILQREPAMGMVHFNLGLLYKHRGEWEKSFFHNDLATTFTPKDDGAWWNLGIAATVLEDWETARTAWNYFGLQYPIVAEDPAGNLGSTPVRLNPKSKPEVVWAIRIDPCRAMLYNIPLPESNHRYHDVVLHDGAPNGFRKVGGREYAVFDELELISRSDYETYSIRCGAVAEAVLDDLEQRCQAMDIGFENWSTQIRMLCKQCSEGRPHETHDHDLGQDFDQDSFLIGFAARNETSLSKVLHAWSKDYGLHLDDFAHYPMDESDDLIPPSIDGKPAHKMSTRHYRKKRMLDWLQDKLN